MTSMEISFSGKNVIVTGAGRGIGRAICVRLVECGANVIAISKTRSNLDDLKKEHPSVETVCVDLSDWDKTRKAVSSAISGKPVYGLVNNAAVAELGKFIDVKPEEFDISYNVNVKSVLNVSQVVARQMIERDQGGVIVNLSSQASKVALDGHAVYCGTKGALDAMSRVMALELGPHKIRVNCVNPTVVMTEMGRLGWTDPAKAGPLLRRIPLGRFGEVSEVVDVVAYLLSDYSSMVTGTELPVDGGFLAC